MRNTVVCMGLSVIGLVGYFLSDNQKQSPIEIVKFSDAESFEHSSFKCNHQHHNTLTQKDIETYNSFLMRSLDEKERHMLTIEDLPNCPLKTELSQFSDQELVKNTLHRIIDLNPPIEDLSEIHVDKNGGVFYACKGLAREGADEVEELLDDLETSDVLGSVPVSTPPVRHSKPDSINTIYLDFNGETISGSGWNDPGESWLCKPYDRDGNPTTFNESEQRHILTAWAKVAEDYAPFDVNVTTERPATMTARVSHVMITPGKDENGVSLPHDGYGGIAYVNVFGAWKDYLISFCQPYSGNSVAEVISHEVGHNMGLSHDGRNGSTYYGGHGSGETSWGPIMGASYGKQVTQWSNGDYSGATNTQDDLAKLKSKLNYKTDDHGDLINEASILKHDSGIINDIGLIGKTGESDVFKFSAKAGTVSLSVNSYYGLLASNGGNLDVDLEVRDSSGNTIVSSNSATDTDASINFNLSEAGNYYVMVSSGTVSGWESEPPTGYSSYGSLGQYFVTGSFVPEDDSEDPVSTPPEFESEASASPAVLGVETSTILSVSAFDSDGDALNYLWSKVSGPGAVNFSNDSLETTMADFSVEGVYQLSVTVSDGEDSISSEVEVTVVAEILIQDSGSFDVRQVSRNHWQSVTLTQSYEDPVVIFSPLTFDGNQSAHIRVKNITNGSFEWQIEEWAYLDGKHLAEKVDYIVLEAGNYSLADGRILIAGNMVAEDSFTSEELNGFTQTPVVVSQLVSASDETPATVRMKNISTSGFEVLVQSEEANNKKHGSETVSYIAVESGMYDGEFGLQEASVTDTSVNHNWYNLSFTKDYVVAPTIFASFQTSNGMDTGDLRIRNLSETGVNVKFHEEKSKDKEMRHVKEKAGYILLDLN